ncbi:MBL fold metallo-hydrolase [Oceanirhabdus sp. W0125-5]|uniref:MBL fold metallo-hydrolase n=1 Tax=Oceanirhabdus sp. W0125-5 TaxID=2999116 RepID=UPI0022F336EA|nr:MBL fold metallo-hydrolase [Oceanirhabdus sp. W0125-5]WBW99539.1 MBL fold metallo-hydrolase [Oceanirhabdus sp. W0125-5]
MIIKRVVAGIYGANCYLVKDEVSGKGFVIDPGGDVDDILKGLNQIHMNVEYILLTHGHLDHTTGAAELQEAVGGKIAISSEDDKLIMSGVKLYGPLLSNGADMHIASGDVIEVGEMKIECIATPGHTPGCISFRVGDVVFTGDTLFYRSIGRTDLDGGNSALIEKSIKEKLYTLPEDTIVYPGHGTATTIKDEKRENSFVR